MFAEMMRLEPFDTMESITERALTTAGIRGVPQRFMFDRKLFEATPAPPGDGCIQMIGEDMGGNYSDFPWVDKGRSSWESTRERAEMEQDRKLAASAKIEQEKERYKAEEAVKAQEKLEVIQRAYLQASFGSSNSAMMWVSEPESQTSATPRATLSMQDIAAITNRYYAQTAVKEVLSESPFSPYAGISRSQNPEQEVLRLRSVVQTVERILGRHLREQLPRAESGNSIYADGPGYAITARDLRTVVQVLDSVAAPQPFSTPFWGVDLGEQDFSATSDDGEKIVLTKNDDRFSSGVLFDPANRPIRKFKLKELPA